jgi:F-type H+-transporting ATPase subunit alpha
VFKQTQYKPLPVELQVAILWAVQNGFFDTVPVDKVKEFQNKLSEYLTTRKASILAAILEKKALDDAVTNELKSAIGDFAATHSNK